MKHFIIISFLILFCLQPVAISVTFADSVDDEVARVANTIRAEGLPWKASRTSVMEMTPQQRRAMLGGPLVLPPVAKPSTFEDEKRAFKAAYPGISAPPESISAVWDWRNKGGINWMTPVTDQGSCGDCWAHATAGGFEARYRIQQGGPNGYLLPVNLAERYTSACYNPAGMCSDWNVPGVLAYLQSSGTTDEDCLPYNHTSLCSDRCSNWNVRLHKVTAYGIYSGSTIITEIQNSVESYGPIPVWLKVYSDFMVYSGGIYVKSATAAELGGHFVNIMGWGSEGGINYWIAKNSWGTDWGEDGYFRIRMGTNEAGIETQAYWLTPQAMPNLSSSTPAGWTFPIVPRGDNTATADNCTLSATLPGNQDNTWWNVNWKNLGTVQARDNVTHLTVDGIYRYWFSLSFQPPAYDSAHVNYGPVTVQGGRHTICLDTIDWNNQVWEYDEDDNFYCRQFVWSPLDLPKNNPLTRSPAPRKDSPGYSFQNNDGFSFLVQAVHPNDWWSAVGVLPSNSAGDYDIRLWNIGDYTGSQQGFGAGYIASSSYAQSSVDFVIVNDNKAPSGTYYAGTINYNNQDGDYRVEHDTSEKIYPRPGTSWNGPYAKTSQNVLDVYEVFLPSAGTYNFYLDQTSGTANLGMTLYDSNTIYAKRSDYIAYANAKGDGADESFQLDIANPGFYGLVVWKNSASDYDKASTYRLAVGPPSLKVTYPNGGETLAAGDTVKIKWSQFGNVGTSVNIDISRDGGNTWSSIAAAAANKGSYPWTVTSPDSSLCRIRVTASSNSAYKDSSNANFTIDGTAPDTTIVSKPENPSHSSTASFGFKSSETGSTFQCRLDGGTYSACTSPKKYTGLAETSHTFTVRARDKAGNIDSSPAGYTWVTDNSDPTLGPVDPSAMTSSAGNAQTFTAIYNDADGYTDLKAVDFRVSTDGSGVNAIWAKYDITHNKLRLYNNTGTRLLAASCSPGDTGVVLQNGQGKINCGATTVTGTSNKFTVRWRITPKTAFASPAPRKLMLKAVDKSNVSSGFKTKGTWTITP